MTDQTVLNTRIIECEACHGDRAFDGGPSGWESHPHSMDPYDGSPITHWIVCNYCGGTGIEEIEVEPITLDDLEEIP